jgi:hypothetical protein
LPLTTRLALVEIIAESVRQELAATTEAPELVMGMLRPEGSVPTDQDLKEDYINYLDDKYK